jgi:hypothetical protein
MVEQHFRTALEAFKSEKSILQKMGLIGRPIYAISGPILLILACTKALGLLTNISRL